MENPNDLAYKAQAELLRQSLTEATQSVFEAHGILVENVEKTKIPEPIFVDHFLPFFSGEHVDPRENRLSEWIAIAGSPMASVDVVDQNNNTVVTIPPVMNSDVISVTSSKMKPISTTFMQYDLEKTISPTGSSITLHNSLVERASGVISADSVTQNTVKEAWDNVFKHYGVIKSNDNTSSAASNSALDNDLSFG